ncbi:MAG TPA: S41 family peptidase [Gemmatimonadaceae bacterium]|nr:S41 family peptidase [Gemmatimonadaceae bacterium]
MSCQLTCGPRRRRWRSSVARAPLLLLVLSWQAVAQRADSSTGRRARDLIAQAIEASGGTVRLAAVEGLRIHGVGEVHREAQVQGLAPDRASSESREEWLTIADRGARASLEYRERRNDGSDRWRRFAYSGDERTVVGFAPRFGARGRFPDSGRLRRELMRRVPQLLLLEVSQNAGSAHALADTLYHGRTQHVVEYLTPDTVPMLRLLLDSATHRLSAVAYLMEYAGVGNAQVEIAFGSYVAHPALGWFPAGHSILLNGVPMAEVHYDRVAVNDASVEDGFRIPDDVAAQMAPGGVVLRPAPGVYVANAVGGLTAMFVEFHDYVLAIEAPAQTYAEFDEVPVGSLPPADSVSAAIIQKIKETIPGKPIRYVTVSHFHNDHAGGVPAFLAEGTTLLTTPGTRAYFERLARARPTAAGDRSTRDGPGSAPRIETIDDRRVLTDGERTVEIINVGRNPHSDEALVVYLPKEGFLYQGDQFYYDGDETFPPRDRIVVMRQFARWLAETKLKVERIYGTHIRGYVTMQHVEQVLRWPEAAVDTSPLRDDLREARRLLDQGHPGAYRFISSGQLDSAFAAASSLVDRPLTVAEFYRLVLPAVCAVKDGHTEAVLPADVLESRRRSVGLLPLFVHVLGDDVVVVHDLSPNGRLAGAAIREVNGVAIGDLLGEMGRATCADGDIPTSRARALDGWGFSSLLAVLHGGNGRFEVLVRRVGRALQDTARVLGAPLDRLRQQLERRFPRAAPPRGSADLRFVDGFTIAHLTIRRFSGAADDSGRTPLESFYRETFETLSRRHTQALILDLRDNGGGWDHLGADLVSYLIPDSVRFYADLLTSPDRLALLTPSEIGEIPPGFMEQLPDGRYRLSGHPSWGILPPRSPQFRGCLVALMNGNSFSSTAEVLSHLHAHRRAVLLGEESGGRYYGSTAGWMATRRLPKSGIVLTVPLVSYTLGVSAGQPPNRGVMPTEPVTEQIADLLARRDVAMQRALSIARHAVAQTRATHINQRESEAATCSGT